MVDEAIMIDHDNNITCNAKEDDFSKNFDTVSTKRKIQQVVNFSKTTGAKFRNSVLVYVFLNVMTLQ